MYNMDMHRSVLVVRVSVQKPAWFALRGVLRGAKTRAENVSGYLPVPIQPRVIWELRI